MNSYPERSVPIKKSPKYPYKKLAQKLKDRQKDQNKAVYIRDIAVYPNNYKHESKPSLYNAQAPNFKSWALTPVVKNFQHLKEITKNLIENASNIHQQKNFQPAKNQKAINMMPGRENHITRMLLPEFSLYTPNPISMKNYTNLIKEIGRWAQNTKGEKENLHILLSSIAVRQKSNSPNKKDRVFNISLYVECGKKPKIQVIAKGTTSPVDAKYKNKKLYDIHKKNLLVRVTIIMTLVLILKMWKNILKKILQLTS